MSFNVPDEYEDHVHPREGEVPAVLYHVAPRAARASIEGEGLAVDEIRTHNTGGEYGEDTDFLHEIGDDGVSFAAEWRPHGVYMFPTIEQALQYHGGDTASDLYVVDAEDLDVLRDPSVAMNWDYDDSHHAYVAEYVPLRMIERMAGHDVTEQAYRAASAGTICLPPQLSALNEAPVEQLSLDDASPELPSL